MFDQPTYEALAQLKGNAQFAAFRLAVGKKAQSAMEAAIISGKSDEVVYARAWRDFWIALETAAENKKPQQIQRPATPVSPAADTAPRGKRPAAAGQPDMLGAILDSGAGEVG